jgi:hypothetical protein
MWKQVNKLLTAELSGLTPSLSYLKNTGGITNAEGLLKKSVLRRLERDTPQDIPTSYAL